jgi:hypothetical protein
MKQDEMISKLAIQDLDRDGIAFCRFLNFD